MTRTVEIEDAIGLPMLERDREALADIRAKLQSKESAC
jgi:hypothetical protein